MLLPCQAMFGIERGNQMREIVEAATGGLCPCMRNQACPLMLGANGLGAEDLDAAAV